LWALIAFIPEVSNEHRHCACEIAQRVLGKQGIDRSRKPIGGTLDDPRGQKVERETGVVAPGTNRHVEFVYRLANAGQNHD
jgi:hypothetical protein